MINKYSVLGFLLLAATAGLGANPPQEPPMDRHHRGFDFLDANKDGKITTDEWMAHFKEIDADKDGFLTRAEMDKHHQMKMEKRHEEMHQKMHNKQP
jgi:Ca2+-binding EF-hand superfamily protein